MLNTSISAKITPSSNNSAASVASDTYTKNQPENEKFSKVLAREVSDKDPGSKKNLESVTTEESFSGPEKEDIHTSHENLTAPLPSEEAPVIVSSYQTIGEGLENNVNPANETTVFLSTNFPDSIFQELVNPKIDIQKQILTPPSLSSSQSVQPFPMQNHYLNNNAWQTFAPVNSVISDQALPPLTETVNTLLSSVDESAQFPATGAAQYSGPSTLAASGSSAMSMVAAPHNLNLDMHMDQPKWGSEFSQKIVWLTSQQQQIAEIRLNPAHLGPVEVVISMAGDQATAHFVSPHAAAREAIEATLPKLKEMMAENGITLGDVTVSADSFKQNADTDPRENKSARFSGYTSKTDSNVTIQTDALSNLSKHNGIVNTFA